jgi:nicotinate phosphoribosyltransferase
MRSIAPLSPVDRHAALHQQLAEMPASVFGLDPRIASAWFSDKYFQRTAQMAAAAGRDPIVRMQVFAKQTGVIAGVYEVIRMFETQLARNPATNKTYCLRDFQIETLADGDEVRPWEPVMHILGPYLAFAHLETPFLGVLARRTLVASNVRRVVEAATGKPVVLMGARHDDWRVQTADGYAARVGGIDAMSSDANNAWWGGGGGVGTMPHAAIAVFHGDVVAATLSFTRYVDQHEPGVNVVSLVDYRNDCVGDAVAVAHAMKKTFGPGKLWGVRLDTSEKMIDRSLHGREHEFPGQTLNGVCPPLVCEVRRALDSAGFPEVKIGVSGGFHPAKIQRFETQNIPVDFYGVGSSLLGHNKGDADGLVNSFDFTADIVAVDGAPQSKVGRERRENSRFIAVDMTHFPPRSFV